MAQCPERKKIWDRVIFLRDSTNVSTESQLKELLSYLGELRKCPVPNDSTLVLLIQRTGKLYLNSGDYVKCIELSNESILYQNSNKIKIYGEDLIPIYAYNNLKICYGILNNYQQQNKAIDSLISLSIQLNNGYDYLIPALFIRASRKLEKADYFSCINDVDLGESILKKQGQQLSNFDYYNDNFVIWKINALTLLRKFNEAEKILNERILLCKKNNSLSSLASFYSLYAQVMEAKGDINNCINYYNQSLAINRKFRNNTACAEILNSIGYLVYSKDPNKQDKALSYYFKALPLSSTKESVNILGNIAVAYVKKRQFNLADAYFKKGLEAIKPGIDEAGLLKLADYELEDNIIEYITSILLGKADAFLKKFKLTGDTVSLSKSITEYHLTDAFFDKIRAKQSEMASKLSWRQNNRHLYENAIEAAYLKNDPENALYFFEKSRAILLREELNEHNSLPQNSLHKLAQVRRTISILKSQSDTLNQASDSFLEVQKELYTNRLELENMLSSIKKNNPIYFQNQLDTSIIRVNDIQNKILKEFSAFIELYNGDSAIYLLTITQRRASIQQIDKSKFDSLSTAYNHFLSSFPELNAHYKEFSSISQNLYKLLFGKTGVPKGRTIISPDGEYFPFEALIVNETKTNTDFFIIDHSVSYSYSANYLLSNFEYKDKGFGGFLGMAPVTFNQKIKLSSLPGSDVSLKKISNFFNNSFILTENKSTKKEFLNNFSNYSVIHLYTHATDSGKNSEPEIWFSDSSLSLSELYSDQKVNTRIIVLSACETATGKIYKSEGVFSFNRGFASIGIPASISNLWEIDSKSTYEITELLYKNIAEGLPTDVALQKAKIEFMASGNKLNSLPYFWAAPILVGKSEIIPFESNSINIWLYIIFGVLIATAIIQIVRKTLHNYRLKS